jgi:hypothetical protein
LSLLIAVSTEGSSLGRDESMAVQDEASGVRRAATNMYQFDRHGGERRVTLSFARTAI